MKVGKYKSPTGEILNVIQVDEEGKRVEVDYGTHCHWWNEDEYLTWTPVEEEGTLITEPEIDEDDVPPTTISEVTENPIVDEPAAKKRKRIPVKPTVKKVTKDKPKKKK